MKKICILIVGLIGSLSLHASNNQPNNEMARQELREFVNFFLSRPHIEFSPEISAQEESRREFMRERRVARLEEVDQLLFQTQNNEYRTLRSRANSFTLEVAQAVVDVQNMMDVVEDVSVGIGALNFNQGPNTNGQQQ